MSHLMSYTGKRIDIPDPKPEQIDIVDIATQLSRLPRFVGATSRHFSVAQHSMIVAYLSVAITEHYSPPPHLDGFLRQQMLKEGLLHDGHESYMGDTPSPLKVMLGSQFRNVERSIDKAVRQKFQLASTMPPNVKVADYMALMIESTHLRGPDTLDLDRIPSEPKSLIALLADNSWYRLAERTVEQHWDHETAKDKFLKEWYYIEG